MADQQEAAVLRQENSLGQEDGAEVAQVSLFLPDSLGDRPASRGAGEVPPLLAVQDYLLLLLLVSEDWRTLHSHEEVAGLQVQLGVPQPGLQSVPAVRLGLEVQERHPPPHLPSLPSSVLRQTEPAQSGDLLGELLAAGHAVPAPGEGGGGVVDEDVVVVGGGQQGRREAEDHFTSPGPDLGEDEGEVSLAVGVRLDLYEVAGVGDLQVPAEAPHHGHVPGGGKGGGAQHQQREETSPHGEARVTSGTAGNRSRGTLTRDIMI